MMLPSRSIMGDVLRPVAHRNAARVDCELGKLHAEMSSAEVPMTAEAAATYIRAAYGKGYVDSLENPDPNQMLAEVPMLPFPELFLP